MPPKKSPRMKVLPKVNILKFKTAAGGKMKKRDTVRSFIEDNVSTALNKMFQEQIYTTLNEIQNDKDCVIFVAGSYGIRAFLEARPALYEYFRKKQPVWWNTVMQDMRDLDLTVYPMEPLKAANCTNLNHCIKHTVVKTLIQKMRELRRNLHNQIRANFDDVNGTLNQVAKDVEQRFGSKIKSIDMINSNHIEIPKVSDGQEKLVFRHGGVFGKKQCSVSNMPDLSNNVPRRDRDKNACYPLRDSLNASLMYRELTADRTYMTDFLLLRLALNLLVTTEDEQGSKTQGFGVNFIDVSVVREEDESVQRLMSLGMAAKLADVKESIKENLVKSKQTERELKQAERELKSKLPLAENRMQYVLPYPTLGYIFHQTVRQFISNHRILDEQTALSKPDQEVLDYHGAKVAKLALRLQAIEDIAKSEFNKSDITWVEHAFDDVPWLRKDDNPTYLKDMASVIINDVLPKKDKYLGVRVAQSLTQKAPSSVALPFTAQTQTKPPPKSQMGSIRGKENITMNMNTAKKSTALNTLGPLKQTATRPASIETISMGKTVTNNDRVVLGSKTNNAWISAVPKSRTLANMR